MILIGSLQGTMIPPRRSGVTMLPFWFGCIAGAPAGDVLLINLIGSETCPALVDGIVISLFVLFGRFALNQWQQYRGIGPSRSYAFGEQTYLVLSLVARSLLPRQVFGGSPAG